MALGRGDSRSWRCRCSISERGRTRRSAAPNGARPKASERARVPAAVGLFLLCTTLAARGDAPGLESYRNEQFGKAYEEFQQTLQKHPNTRAADKIQFDAGAAAYKMKDYGKALQSFSQALLSPDLPLQSRSHYNLGNTLYQRGETQKGNGREAQGLDERSATLRADAEASSPRTRRRRKTPSS